MGSVFISLIDDCNSTISFVLLFRDLCLFFFFWSLPPQQISIISTHAHTHIHTGYEFRNIEWRENKKKKKNSKCREKRKCRCCETGIWISHVILEPEIFEFPVCFLLTIIKLRCTGDDGKRLNSQSCEWWHLNAQP